MTGEPVTMTMNGLGLTRVFPEGMAAQQAQQGCFGSVIGFLSAVGADALYVSAFISDPVLAAVSPTGVFWGGVALIGVTADAYWDMIDDCDWGDAP